MHKIGEFSDIFIFSGVIRNYFLSDYRAIRDLDIVFDCSDRHLLELLAGLDYRRNSFGGYKVILEGLTIDLWHIDNTWAFQRAKVNGSLFKEHSLAETAFFNFSSIVYNLRRREFICKSDFLDFLNERILDFVLEENPLPQLCIVNTIYYKRQFKLKLSERLKLYFIDNFHRFSEEEYQSIQLKHFGDQLFSYGYLKTYCKIFKGQLNHLPKVQSCKL